MLVSLNYNNRALCYVYMRTVALGGKVGREREGGNCSVYYVRGGVVCLAIVVILV